MQCDYENLGGKLASLALKYCCNTRNLEAKININ